jgi:hypothetical protein
MKESLGQKSTIQDTETRVLYTAKTNGKGQSFHPPGVTLFVILKQLI